MGLIYENFRVHLIAKFDKIKNDMKIDITTGDAITPKEIDLDILKQAIISTKEKRQFIAYEAGKGCCERHKRGSLS